MKDRLIQKELLKRKEFMKSIRNEEIAEFAQKVKDKLNEAKHAAEEKTQKLKEKWKETKNSLPNSIYTTSFEELTEEDKKHKKEELIQTNLQAKKDFCENNVPKPVIDERKKIELEKLNEKKNL